MALDHEAQLPSVEALQHAIESVSNVRRWATASEVSKTALYAWASGSTPIPIYATAKLVRGLIRLGRQRLAEQLFAGMTGAYEWGVVVSMEQAPDRKYDPRDSLLVLSEDVGKTAAQLRDALADGRIDAVEMRELQELLEVIKRDAEAARQAIEAVAGVR